MFVYSFAQNEIINHLQQNSQLQNTKDIIRLRNLIAAEMRLSAADSATSRAYETPLLPQKDNNEWATATHFRPKKL